MNIDEILLEKGFEAAAENRYKKSPGDPEGISILLETTGDRLRFRVHCASTTVDHEKEIEDHLIEHERLSRCVKASFCLRVLELEYIYTSGEEAEECIDSALNAIEDADSRFGFMPVCSLCDRVIRSEAVLLDGELQNVCGICSDSMKLHARHERLVQEHIEKEKQCCKEFSAGKLCGRFLLAGFVAGLWACAVALPFALLGMLFNIVRLASVAAGITGALALMRNLRKINPVLTFKGLFMANAAMWITMPIVSIADTSLLRGFLEMLTCWSYDIVHPMDVYNVIPYMIMGLIVMVTFEYIAAFWLKEDVTGM